jgi:hypothetical protein
MVQVMITSVMMIYAGGNKCDDGQWKDVMIASLVVSVAQSHGRGDDGQCDDHVGQCEVDAIITMVSDHIIGQCHALVNLTMVNVMLTLGSVPSLVRV